MAEPHALASTEGSQSDDTTVHEQPDKLRALLNPEDCYDEHGIYWADLPARRKIGFAVKSYNQESKREAAIIWSMFKKDPLSPVVWWFKNCVMPGAGIGLEGYVLFSIGNIRPLLEAVYPSCWAENQICQKGWIEALEYLAIIGIICGQLSIGYIGDKIGRRWGLIQDICIMFLALVLLTSAWASSYNGWIIFYGWSLFIYGVGVGGEYPMTATSIMERVKPSVEGQKADRLHRGRDIISCYMMQGVGGFGNQLVLVVLLLIFNTTRGNPPYSAQAAQLTYRGSFLVATLGTLYLVYYRIFRMKFAKPVKHEGTAAATGYSTESIKLTFRHYGSRLLATGGIWFCNDLFWFGNKLFQSKFIEILTPGDMTIITRWKWNLVNTSIVLYGYIAAAFFMDHKLYGRKRMVVIGFSIVFIFFALPAFNYEYFTSPKGVHLFMGLYFMAGFFGQFGSNCVIFLAAAEVYPKSVRATAHGISAAIGKVGGLIAAVLFNFIDTRTKFWFIPWVALVGAIISFIFLPDTTGLDLKECERRWEFICAGRDSEYCGVAVHRKHLSLWERWRGVGRQYDAKLDYSMRLEEMGTEWERAQHDNEEQTEGSTMVEEWHREVHDYFRRTRGSSSDDRSKEKL